MIQTVPADFIGKENVGYVLLALLSENAQTRISELLKDLNMTLPGALWTMPPKQMHITLCEIIQPKLYTEDKDILYKRHEALYENAPAQILSSLPRFTITFNIIECSPQAVIIRSNNASSFNSIRNQLVKTVPMPTETRTPPDIIHSTIARYLKEMDVEKVQQVIMQHKVFIEEEITEFKLLRVSVPPLCKYETLKTYPLGV